jgi:hypothetical protein
MSKRLIGALATLAVTAVMVGATVAGAATVSKPGVSVVCTNTQTGKQIVDLTLPTTKIATGSFTHGKLSCTVTSATFTGGGAAPALQAVHVTCVNGVTGNTIVDRNLRTAGIRPGVYMLGKVTCTVSLI